MPKPRPREFRDDVVAVARRGEAPIAQIAKDVGISESCLRNWLHKADVEDGVRPGVTVSESVELRGAEAPQPAAGTGERRPPASRRVPVTGEPAGTMTYPLVSELAADGIPVTVTCRVLKLARQPSYRDGLVERLGEEARHQREEAGPARPR